LLHQKHGSQERAIELMQACVDYMRQAGDREVEKHASYLTGLQRQAGESETALHYRERIARLFHQCKIAVFGAHNEHM
jgi:hypothetical protein